MSFCTTVQQAFTEAKNSEGVPYPDQFGTYYSTFKELSIDYSEYCLENNRRSLANTLYKNSDKVPAELLGDPEALREYAISLLSVANGIINTEVVNSEINILKQPEFQRKTKALKLEAMLAAKFGPDSGKLEGQFVVRGPSRDETEERLEKMKQAARNRIEKAQTQS